MDSIPKISNVMSKVRSKAQSGDFVVLPHAVERRKERDIAIVDIVRVLTHGEHEESKDQFKPEYRAWNYAIRGKTIDNRTLRVAVSFDESHMLVITVIRIGRKR